MRDDFGRCMVSNARMAARALTRRYDAYLRPHDLTATQFSLLGALRMLPDATVSELAEARGFERTTLTRNLDRLEAMGLISSHHPERGNGRIPKITQKGEALIDRLLPLWRKAQAELEAELSPQSFDTSITILQRLAKV